MGRKETGACFNTMKTMTQEKQRIAIAEWCGWYRLHHDTQTWAPKGWVYGKDTYDKLKKTSELPNYPQDLNACHEMEKNLLPEQTSRYENLLALQVFKEDKDEYWVNGIKHINAYCFHATASQRCEALYRTLWPERWV